MLMQTQPVETLSPELTNCYALLDYLDNGFQERIDAGQVDFSGYFSREADECGAWGCLAGWFAHDVLGVKGFMALNHVGAELHAIETNPFGMSFYTPILSDDVFGVNSSTIADRRAALVRHIAYLEGEE